jgi:hypothetical protein
LSAADGRRSSCRGANRYELNRDVVGRSFAGVPFLADTPAAELDALAGHLDLRLRSAIGTVTRRLARIA